MRTIAHLVALAMTASAAAAQSPAPPPIGPGGPGSPAGERGVQLLLGRSAELDLTHAQVVKLAAIARRAEARRRTM